MNANQIESSWFSRSTLRHRHYFLAELGRFVCGLEMESSSKFGKHKPFCAKCEQQLKSLEIMGLEDYVIEYKARNQH